MYTYIEDVAKEVDIPQTGILTRALFNDEQVKTVIFGFDAGEELSEHTASVPAILYMVQGEAEIKLGEDTKQVRAGAWTHMTANFPHSIRAISPVIMLLFLLKNVSSTPEK